MKNIKIEMMNGMIFNSNATIRSLNTKAIEHFTKLSVPLLRVKLEVSLNESNEGNITDGYYIGGEFSKMSKKDFREYIIKNNLTVK